MRRPKVPLVSEAEDARITAAALSDPDNPPLTEADFANARPAIEVVPHIVERHRRARGKQKAPLKADVHIKLDQDIVDHFKAGGRGWQTRLNAKLREVIFGE